MHQTMNMPEYLYFQLKDCIPAFAMYPLLLWPYIAFFAFFTPSGHWSKRSTILYSSRSKPLVSLASPPATSKARKRECMCIFLSIFNKISMHFGWQRSISFCSSSSAYIRTSEVWQAVDWVCLHQRYFKIYGFR